jgi:hypothetical protein
VPRRCRRPPGGGSIFGPDKLFCGLLGRQHMVAARISLPSPFGQSTSREKGISPFLHANSQLPHVTIACRFRARKGRAPDCGLVPVGSARQRPRNQTLGFRRRLLPSC